MPGGERVNRIKNYVNGFISSIEKISPHFLAAAIVIYLIGLEFLTINYHQPVADLGEFVNNAYRVTYGQMPYRDFWLLFTPGEVFFPAMIYKIFGVNSDALRYTMIILGCSTSLIAFYFGRDLFKKNWAAAVFAFLYYYASVIYHYESPAYIHFYYTLALVAAWFLSKLYRSGEIKYAAYAGAALAGAIFFRLYESGAAAAAMSVALLYYAVAAKKSVFKVFGAMLGGFFLVLIIEFLPFAGIMSHLIREAVFESVKNGTSMNLPYFWDASLMFDSVWNDFAKGISLSGIPLIISHLLRLVSFTTFYILPIIAPILILAFFYLEKDVARRAIALTLFLWGLFSLAKGIGRSDISHMAPGDAPFTLFALYSAYAIAKNVSKAKLRSAYIGVTASMIVGILITMTSPIIRLPDQIRMPFTKVHAPYGAYASNKPEDVAGVKYVFESVERYTREGDYIFVTPWGAPALYAMTHRKNPTYFDSMNDPVVRPSEKSQRRIIDALISSKTKLIVNADWGYDEKPHQRFKNACRMVQSFIETNYVKVGEKGGYEVWLLRNS